MDEDDTQVGCRYTRIVNYNTSCEIIEAAGQFRPRKASPGNHERQQCPAAIRVKLCVSPLKHVYDVVPNSHRVGKSFEFAWRLSNRAAARITRDSTQSNN
jgi:hypothetical protein